ISDPIQDVGFSFSSCSDIETQPYLKASILLRQSIDELYVYVDLLKNKSFVIYHNEPICLRNFPCFSFCGKRRG
ncbi:lymphocyte antigen 86 precursor, partial [Silurus asotus]